jgi:TatD DNase family protein
MNSLIDTHAHLYLDAFSGEYDEVTQRAVAAGVHTILLPNIDRSSVAPMLELYKKYPGVYRIMTGLHPTSVKADWEEELDAVLSLLEDYEPAAVGEAGIDLYWDKTFEEEQKAAFIRQIDYAMAKSLPLVIHSRNSLDIILAMLKPYTGKVSGVFHCFPGSVQQAKKAVDAGFMLGIGGVVTYKNSKMAEVAALLPLQSIVLETDAPFLSPQSERGRRNESANIAAIAAFIAGLRNIGADEVAAITTLNAQKLFKLNQK